MAGQNSHRGDSGGRRITHSGHRGAKGPCISQTRPPSLQTGRQFPTRFDPAPDESDVRYPARAAAQSGSIYWRYRPTTAVPRSHQQWSFDGALRPTPAGRSHP